MNKKTMTLGIVTILTLVYFSSNLEAASKPPAQKTGEVIDKAKEQYNKAKGNLKDKYDQTKDKAKNQYEGAKSTFFNNIP